MRTTDRNARRTWTGAALAALALVAVAAAPAHAATTAQKDALPELLADYATIHETLSADRSEGVEAAAARIAARAEGLAKSAEPKALHAELAAAAKEMKGTEIAALREAMKKLSVAMAALVDASATKAAGFYYCPMVGAYWLQKPGDEAVRNPYDPAMLSCGSKVEKVYADEEEG